MKLNLEHLAPYLPYGLEYDMIEYPYKRASIRGLNKFIAVAHYDDDSTGKGTNTTIPLGKLKPILRPLSDLTNTIFIGEENFMPLDRLLSENNFDTEVMIMEDKLEYIEPLTSLNFANYTDIAKLLSWHFDVFGLIEKGLAVNINNSKHISD